MSHPRFALLVLAGVLLLPSAQAGEASDKKEEKKPEPPGVAVVIPLAASSGTTNKLKIRGQNLTNVTQVRFTNDAVKAALVIKNKSKVELPKEADAKKVGDTQMEVELTLAADALSSTNWFVVISPDGQSEPRPLVFLPPGRLVEEKEPNGGFKQAQAIRPGQTISGIIKEAGDVDVFAFAAMADATYTASITAAESGSALDALITIYDRKGNIVASNDDADGRPDPRVTWRARNAGCFISVVDANEKGGPTHVYLLSVTAEK